MKLFSLLILVISFLFLIFSCKEPESKPIYAEFVGEYTGKYAAGELKVSIADTPLGLKIFVNNEELAYVSKTGQTLGASNRRSPVMDILLVENKAGVLEFKYGSGGSVVQGILIRKQ